MNRPRRVFLLLFLCLLGTCAVAVPAHADASTFPDVGPDHPYAAAIDRLAGAGILHGRTDGTFGPDDPVSRCQFAKLVVNTLGIAHDDLSMPFVDVGPGDLPDFVAAAARTGITKGTDDSGRYFSPWSSVGRAQAISMTVRGVEGTLPDLVVEEPNFFSEWGPFGVHARAVTRAEVSGLLAGLPFGALDPWAPMTRGEVAQILANVLRIIDQGVPGEPAEVIEVVDEATLRVAFRGAEEVVGLIGIGVPSRDLPYRTEARQWLSDTVMNRAVVLQLDAVQRDDAGRLLVYAFASGELVNAELLRAGYAQYWRSTLFNGVGMRFARDIGEGAFEGKANRRGLWAGWVMPPFTIVTWRDRPSPTDDLNQEWLELRSTSAAGLLGWCVENWRGDRYYFPDMSMPAGESFFVYSGAGTDDARRLYWGASGDVWRHVLDRWTTEWVVNVYDDQDRLVYGVMGMGFADYAD